jgi:hypothetical protein
MKPHTVTAIGFNGFVKVRLEFTDGSPYEWFELQEYIREIAREELEKAKNAE